MPCDLDPMVFFTSSLAIMPGWVSNQARTARIAMRMKATSFSRGLTTLAAMPWGSLLLVAQSSVLMSKASLLSSSLVACGILMTSQSIPLVKFLPTILTWNGTWGPPGIGQPVLITPPKERNSAGEVVGRSGLSTISIACLPRLIWERVRRRALSSIPTRYFPKSIRVRCLVAIGRRDVSIASSSNARERLMKPRVKSSWPVVL